MNEATNASGTLTGRTALITGAVGAIGRALVAEFASCGARIVVADLSETACNQLASETTATYGVEAMGLGVDVSNAEKTAAAALTVAANFGVCDAIVINAGILTIKPVLEITPAEWHRTVSVNLTGAFNTAQAFGLQLVETGKPGTIVFSSSLFGVRGGAGNAAYSATKFGLIGLTESMAADLAGQRIRVNAVCPGQIDTAMMRELFSTRATENETTTDEEEARFVSRIPIGSLGRVDEIARVYSFLSSEASSYITGQHIVVDGGWQVG
jgi:NAD(P)-dependent dehydrogenase (short-subunit alcohol dehydrogenase family)